MLVFFLIAASSARADAGTALMWTGMLHLFIGNWLIALLEAAVVSRAFHVPFGRAANWLIAANFTSFFAGAGLLWLTSDAVQRIPGLFILRHGIALIGAAVGVSYLVSVVVEWPFCRAIAAPGTGRWRTALRMSLIAQTMSYAVIVPLYYAASPITFLTQARWQSSAFFASPAVATIYYVGTDNAVWSVNSDGTDRRPVGIPNIEPETNLWIVREKSGWGDLCAMLWLRHQSHRRYAAILLKTAFAQPGTYAAKPPHGDTLSYEDWLFTCPGDLRSKGQGKWRVRLDVFAGRGITVSNGSHSYNLALETPYLAWRPDFATILPGDIVVFQLGPQIVLLDMPTKRFAVLAEGRCPVAVLTQAKTTRR